LHARSNLVDQQFAADREARRALEKSFELIDEGLHLVTSQSSVA
jgi:hypothetical protein